MIASSVAEASPRTTFTSVELDSGIPDSNLVCHQVVTIFPPSPKMKNYISRRARKQNHADTILKNISKDFHKEILLFRYGNKNMIVNLKGGYLRHIVFTARMLVFFL